MEMNYKINDNFVIEYDKEESANVAMIKFYIDSNDMDPLHITCAMYLKDILSLLNDISLAPDKEHICNHIITQLSDITLVYNNNRMELIVEISEDYYNVIAARDIPFEQFKDFINEVTNTINKHNKKHIIVI